MDVYGTDQHANQNANALPYRDIHTTATDGTVASGDRHGERRGRDTLGEREYAMERRRR